MLLRSSASSIAPLISLHQNYVARLQYLQYDLMYFVVLWPHVPPHISHDLRNVVQGGSNP